MKHKIFVVFDCKAEAFMQPFFQPTTGQALRSWATVVNDPSTQFCRYPGDFTLFEVGEYDEQTGTFSQYEHKKNLGTALEFKETPASPAPLFDRLKEKQA